MTDNQLGKIRNTGLAGLVDGWCISEEVGMRKPEPGIFRLAAERCGSSLGPGGWMVGDNLVLDIAGGHAAGLRTVWLPTARQVGPVPTAGPRPDATAGSVAEAVEVILNSPLTWAG
jgi:FMN phosphatase YigB (HAD superfamily)